MECRVGFRARLTDTCPGKRPNSREIWPSAGDLKKLYDQSYCRTLSLAWAQSAEVTLDGLARGWIAAPYVDDARSAINHAGGYGLQGSRLKFAQPRQQWLRFIALKIAPRF